MKREIKFRAWDGFRMHHDFQFVKSGSENNDWIIFTSDKQTLKDDWKNNPFFQAQLEIMQFTGLHDKNGKEIYEGDILKIQYFKITAGEDLGVSEIEAELHGVIEINPLALVLKNIVGEKWCEYTGYEQGEGECKVFHLHDVYEGSSDAEWQIEVIGNIYENPNLINNQS